MVGFWFPALISIVHDSKRSCSLSTKVNRSLCDMVKIRIIIIQNVNIFTIYETLFENVMTILLVTYLNKTKIPGQNRKWVIYLYEVASYIEYIQAIVRFPTIILHVNFVKFLIAYISKEHLWWLLLLLTIPSMISFLKNLWSRDTQTKKSDWYFWSGFFTNIMTHYWYELYYSSHWTSDEY